MVLARDQYGVKSCGGLLRFHYDYRISRHSFGSSPTFSRSAEAIILRSFGRWSHIERSRVQIYVFADLLHISTCVTYSCLVGRR